MGRPKKTKQYDPADAPVLPEQMVDPFPKSLSRSTIFDREYWDSRDTSLDDYEDVEHLEPDNSQGWYNPGDK